MRFSTILILLGCLLLAIAPGCQKASLQCRRETALLRAEILDLEDKYYALKSQHRSAMVGEGGSVTSNGIVGNGVIVGSEVMDSLGITDSYPILEGDVIYEDQMLPGSSTIIQGPADGEIYYEGVVPSTQQPMMQGSQYAPTQTEPESYNLELETTPIDTTGTGIDQSLVLPVAPELKVGYEDFELDALGDGVVDRIEIVTAGTRGKDLDRIAGDDGIELMVRTLSVDGAFVDKRGEMTVTINDQLVGEIGKWTFLPEELKLFLSRDELGNVGTLLHLPWSDRVPVSKQVSVRVSMIIGDVEYIATRRIGIKPPTGDVSEDKVVGWTTNDTRWITDAQPAPLVRRGAAPTSLPKTPSAAVKRPQWKPVR